MKNTKIIERYNNLTKSDSRALRESFCRYFSCSKQTFYNVINEQYELKKKYYDFLTEYFHIESTGNNDVEYTPNSIDNLPKVNIEQLNVNNIHNNVKNQLLSYRKAERESLIRHREEQKIKLDEYRSSRRR